MLPQSAHRPPRHNPIAYPGGGGGGSLHGSGTLTPQGSGTQTITSTSTIDTLGLRSGSPDSLVLRLRGAHARPRSRVQQRSQSPEESDPTNQQRRRIQWAEDVVDNEGLGRKKSKVCCIYHKTRAVGESSSEDDSSSDSSSSDDESSGGASDDGAARPVGGGRGRSSRSKRRRRKHDHNHDHGHGDGDECAGGSGPRRKPSPNAYEKMPKYDVQPLQRQPGR